MAPARLAGRQVWRWDQHGLDQGERIALVGASGSICTKCGSGDWVACSRSEFSTEWYGRHAGVRRRTDEGDARRGCPAEVGNQSEFSLRVHFFLDCGTETSSPLFFGTMRLSRTLPNGLSWARLSRAARPGDRKRPARDLVDPEAEPGLYFSGTRVDGACECRLQFKAFILLRKQL